MGKGEQTPSSSSPSSTTSIASGRFGGAFSFKTEILTQRPGYLAFRVTGPDAERAFEHESGGHRFQRVPPTERRGRVHTSTITVAVLPEPKAVDVQIDDRDLVVETTGSGGPGGQHANKADSAVILTHRPTGIRVRVETKSQHRNRQLAMSILRARLAEREQGRLDERRNEKRRRQVGSGMRACKVRTVALQRGKVTDHRTGKRAPAKRYMRGEVELLWP